MDFEQYMIPCLSKKIIGIDCPGCGMQRAILLFFQGDFQAAFQMNAAVLTTILFIIFVFLHFVDKQRNYHQLIRVFAVINTLIMIIAYIFKMYKLLN